MSNYVRNAIIERNEFRYPGDSAIASLGSTELIDGTNGDQPRGTKIINDLMHENGIYGKQSGAYFQSLTAQVEFDGNISFSTDLEMESISMILLVGATCSLTTTMALATGLILTTS